MKLAIAGDHAAVEYKTELKAFIEGFGHEVVDYGTNSLESVNYSEIALNAAEKIQSGECERGIFICGSGVGVSIAANKVKGIRAVVCSEPFSAKMSRIHNDSNVLCLGARVVGIELAKMIVENWLNAEFEGGRHQARIDIISEYESK